MKGLAPGRYDEQGAQQQMLGGVAVGEDVSAVVVVGTEASPAVAAALAVLCAVGRGGVGCVLLVWVKVSVQSCPGLEAVPNRGLDGAEAEDGHEVE